MKMIDVTNAKPLKVANDNNKLQQKEFIVIHFAPARAHFNRQGDFVPGVLEKDFDRVYVIEDNGMQIFVKLNSFLRLPFKDISSWYTQLCSGQDAYFWKFDFMTKYPQVTNDTELAVYYYERVEK